MRKKNTLRDKFIINVSPGEINSPEEQIRALKETIFLAVYLNRTLVLPNFFKSKNDFSVRKNIHEKRVVDPQDWISMIRMMRYIPVITLDELYEHCIEFEVGYVFEDPDEPNFTIDPFVVKEMDRLEKETGVKFLSRDDDTFRGTLIGPINSNSETDLKMNSKSIPNYFGENNPKNYNARCVAVLNPKEIIPYGHHLKTWADMVGGGGTEDYVTLDTDLPLVSAMVMKSTGRPKWCKDIIDQFRTSWGLEKGFVTLVYDDNHLEVLTQEVEAVADKHRWTVVYVIIDNVYGEKENEAILEEISKLTKMSLMSRKTLTDFLLKKYKNCPKERFEDELDETIELLEQQIGFQSNAVVGSVLEGSETRAWVRNLRDERLAWRDHKLDFYLEGPRRMTGVMRGDLDYF